MALNICLISYKLKSKVKTLLNLTIDLNKYKSISSLSLKKFSIKFKAKLNLPHLTNMLLSFHNKLKGLLFN